VVTWTLLPRRSEPERVRHAPRRARGVPSLFQVHGLAPRPVRLRSSGQAPRPWFPAPRVPWTPPVPGARTRGSYADDPDGASSLNRRGAVAASEPCSTPSDEAPPNPLSLCLTAPFVPAKTGPSEGQRQAIAISRTSGNDGTAQPPSNGTVREVRKGEERKAPPRHLLSTLLASYSQFLVAMHPCRRSVAMPLPRTKPY
jgi:hypothetical protein